MELEIQYFPQTDTLYIGGAGTANEGYDIAENLIAHAKDDGEVIGITIEHASEILSPYLRGHIVKSRTCASASILYVQGSEKGDD